MMKPEEINSLGKSGLLEEIRTVILQARRKALTAVNFAMVSAYWEVGRLIVERQGGSARAEYGNALIESLSEPLSREFGKSLDARELRRMRQFYLTYPIRDALRPELGWTHYRQLLSVESSAARDWYLQTAANDNPTIGLLLCSKKNEAVAHYSVLNESKQLFASRYLLHLPTEEELKCEIERERRMLESQASAERP